MPDALLEVRDLSVSFRTENGIVRAVDGLSLSIALGEVIGIVGESGSGKTVSMMAVMRLIRDPNAVVEGEVLLRGRNLMNLPQREMRLVRGGEIAMIFQDPMTALTPVYTVGWQIGEQLRAHDLPARLVGHHGHASATLASLAAGSVSARAPVHLRRSRTQGRQSQSTTDLFVG